MHMGRRKMQARVVQQELAPPSWASTALVGATQALGILLSTRVTAVVTTVEGPARGCQRQQRVLQGTIATTPETSKKNQMPHGKRAVGGNKRKHANVGDASKHSHAVKGKPSP